MGFSPDGAQLLFVQPDAPPYDQGVVTVDGERRTEMLLQTEFSESNGVISPNGRWLAYDADESGRSEIYVRPFPDVDSRRIQMSTDGGTRPLWSRDGRELFYFKAPGTLIAVPVDPGPSFTAGNPEVLFEGSYPAFNTGRHYDVSPDGRGFLMLTEAGETDEDSAGPQINVVLNWTQELLERVPVN